MMTNSSLTQHTQQLTEDMVEMAQVSCSWPLASKIVNILLF